MWSKPAVAKFQRALAASQKWKPALDKLAEIAKVSPRFRDRIEELKTRAENVEQLATVALSIDSSGT